MVNKKKVKRKVSKRKPARRKTIEKGTTLHSVHEKFNNYQEQIDRLKQYESELKKIDTRGFKKEVSIIKAQLNDPTAIPEIERRLNALKRKILKKRKSASPIKRRSESVSDIKEELPEVKSQINVLKKKIEEGNDKKADLFKKRLNYLEEKRKTEHQNIKSQISRLNKN